MERQILREEGSGILIVYPLLSACTVSPSQIVAPFSTITQGEAKDVTPGQAGIRTPQVLALASAPAPARVSSCPAKPCILEQAPCKRNSARR